MRDAVRGRTSRARPALGSDDAATRQAACAVARFVEELQASWDEHDADVSDRHFADDVAWGSPFGATVNSYDRLHAIHVRLKQLGRGGRSSRYETVRVLAPAPNVAIAHVRRVALDPAGRPLEPTPDTSGPWLGRQAQACGASGCDILSFDYYCERARRFSCRSSREIRLLRRTWLPRPPGGC
jgi:hypothetical protein